MKRKYYAVKKGKKPGIYRSWEECRAQVSGFSGARYKSFLSEEEALTFLQDDENQEMESDENTMTAYVDGSFDKNKKAFSYGMVILFQGKETYFAEKYTDPALASMRNVAGEIMGAQAAMSYAVKQGCKKLMIYYDYEGIQKWCSGEWKANKEGTKAYRAFYEEKKKTLQMKFIKVKGHSNDKYNDMADMLAKSALGIGDGSFLRENGNQWIRQLTDKGCVLY